MNYLKDGWYSPHVNNSRSKVLAKGSKEGEQGNSKEKWKKQELNQEDGWKLRQLIIYHLISNGLAVSVCDKKIQHKYEFEFETHSKLSERS